MIDEKTMVADTLAGINGELTRFGEMIPQTENKQLTRFITGCGDFHFYSYRIAVSGHIIYLLSSIDSGRISIRLSFIVVAAPISDKRPWVNVLNPQPFCV